MFLNAIIFEKLKSVFSQLNANAIQYYLTFTPVSTNFTNQDFNFLNPGISAAELSDGYENQMAFAYFANAIIRNPKVYSLNIDDFLQNSYKKIFDNALLIDSSISEEDKQAYRDAKAILFKNDNFDVTPDYEKYNGYKTRYADITAQIQDITDKIMANPEDTDSISKQEDLKTKQNIIFNDWLFEGNKEKIEKALKTVANINARSAFVSQWNDEYSTLKTKLANLTTVNSNIDFLPVSCLPNNLFEYAYHGWKKITIEESEIQTLSDEAKNSFGEDFYNASDDADADLSKIEFEYLFVTLLRNWFKPQLINSDFWSFASSNTETVSDDTDLAKGLMPSYIDKFIFIRRVYAYNKINPAQPEPSAADTSFKTYRFKDFATLKKVNEIKSVAPVESSSAKVRLLSANNQVSHPVIMKRSLAPGARVFTGTMLAAQPVAAVTRDQTLRAAAFQPAGHVIIMHRPIAMGEAGQITTQPDQPAPPPRTNFNLTLYFKDELNNTLSEINPVITNKKDGASYSAETGNDGKVYLPNLINGDYSVVVQNEDLFEDTELSIQLTTDIEKTIVLKKRANPRFDMFLIGAINYRFPKLPNPLPGYTYS